ncbi:MAG: Gfo/Idh/MocA family oxidoreductase [SAR324 cluster bacterium]|nr:Gfo/Idh/MocA family oxidoreductase [SAR324 cluster bacterium]
MINVGFIGAGDISYLHGEALQRCANAQLRGLWSVDPGLAKEKCKLFSCQNFNSAEALVNDPQIDVVFILTNMETHHDYAILAMEAGKHVLVEKPIASSCAEIESMKAAAQKQNVIFAPGHNYIHEESLIRTRELIETGKLGDLTAIYIMYHIHHPEEVAMRYPGVIRQILTHHSYILLYLAGVPESLSAMKTVVHYKEFTGEDIAMVNFKMKNGALAHFSANFAADDHSNDPWTFVVKVIGTKGATRFSYRDWVENKPAEVHSQTYSAYPYSVINEDRFFIEECIQKGTPPLSTIDDALICQKIVEASELSAAEGRMVHL